MSAVSFQTYWNLIQNGGGCFSNEHIRGYLEIILDKNEQPGNRLEVLSSLLQTPTEKTSLVISILKKIEFEKDDPAFVALNKELSWIISALETKNLET